ncbi:RNA polymerase sigma factor SigJ [Actinoplanes sp. NPDC051411]|uniref:RNA polymerase sigma factor SigJ n=1 Tax=Actinoplanes sp. NPDC051411 TaxID=3155522 RepID=UPI0034437460
MNSNNAAPASAAASASADVTGERRHLMSVAFRMLGTVAEAEDAVQEAYARWYRLAEPERAAIEAPAGWLTRVTSRICLDMLGSARARHENYVGPWLPEPVPPTEFPADPVDKVALDDTVSAALLVVLESMTPAERVVFVLHDVFAVPFGEIAETVGRSPAACRQLAASARRRVRAFGSRLVPRGEHERVVRSFGVAANSGDLTALIRSLDPGAVLRTDGGGVTRAALNEVVGADRVARFLTGIIGKRPDLQLRETETSEGPALAMHENGHVVGIITFEATPGGITGVSMILNPNKLTRWNTPVSPSL